ncbi:hypothetical protein F4819DRAFT_478526 [Hypoxylon fuscum]|nr:hypothetical protein F4819DRAFT_478526 [Hypoxylon fuscum]
MNNSGIASWADAQQIKRLACDRCRAQKLKCVRPELSEICQRCHKAKAHCSFGRPLPPGRPPTIRPLIDDLIENYQAPRTPATQRRESDYSSLSFDLQLNCSNGHDLERRALSTTRRPQSIDTFDPGRVLSQLGNLDNEKLLNMLYDDGGAPDLDASTFGTWSTASSTTNGNSPPWRSMEQQNDTSAGDLTCLADGEFSAISTDPRTSSHCQRQDLMDHTRLNKRQINGSTPSSTKHSPPSFMSSLNDSEGSTISNQVALMQRLTELGSAMYELQNRYSPKEYSCRPGSEAFPTELTGKVLQVAIEFLKLLRRFFLDGPSPSIDAEDRGYRRAFGHYPTPTFFEPRSRPQGVCQSASSPAERPFGRVSDVDKPTVLQLIANYIRLLQLYLLLHNTIYDYLRLIESDFRRSQPIWSDLTIGGAPLYQFADFQIKFVLQVAAGLLEEVEGALGLSEGCRVSKKPVVEGGGILGKNVTSRFVEICMSEATTGSEQGRGIVTRLRDLMHCLMNTLDKPFRF